MKFTKMQAIGNDFVVLDRRGASIEDLNPLARKLCHRRFGVGADQLLILADSGSADFRMLIFNADGSEVEMCGNGIRSIAKYIWSRGISDKNPIEIETLAGIIRPERVGDLIRVDMGEPILDAERIPVAQTGRVMDYPLEVRDRTFKLTCVSMGNPHAVIFEQNVKDMPILRYGPRIETHPMFPRRTNVEFVEVMNRSEIRMRVWERGAGETLACGTGASASVVAAVLKGLTDRKVTVHLDGGDLDIEWSEGGRVFMTGPAEEVFEGTLINSFGGKNV